MARLILLAVTALLGLTASPSTMAAEERPSTGEIQAIAEQAAIYSLPMVMNYGTMYAYAVDRDGPQFKGPFNKLVNEAKVYTPADTAVILPNSDTPYSFVWVDLRAEPQVVCVPEIPKDRYYSVQLVSLYTYNFGYIGSRATGNDQGCYLITGPSWTGEKPARIDKAFESGTDFAFVIFRTQLFDPADIDNVKAIQAKYSVQSLSAFLDEKPPQPAPPVEWPKIDKESAAKDPLGYLSFLLQFAPATGSAAVEKPLRQKFASIGIVPGKPFSTEGWSDQEKAALIEGLKNGAKKIHERAGDWGHEVHGWQISKEGFGSRAILGEDYLLRAAAAVKGIYGNDAAEALYPFAEKDGSGVALDSSKDRYTLTFPPGGLPPVHAFWSVTMYDARTRLLVANKIGRYLVNSPMLPDLKKNADGAVELHIQKDEPTDPDEKAGWLPAPDGPFLLVMRLYWPEDTALSGAWAPPSVSKGDVN